MMGPDMFLSFLPVVLGLAFVGFIALGVAAVQDGKHTSGKSDIVRRGYIYLVSFVTLLLVALSVANLADLGLRSAVLTKADPTAVNFLESPPALFLSSKMPAPGTAENKLTCDTDCAISEQDRTDIANWVTNFTNWKERTKSTNLRAQAMMTPLSFLAIAGIVFLFHWRFVRRDRQNMEVGSNLTRSTYFASMSFIWLIIVVIVGGMLLNTTLRTAIPGAQDAKRPYMEAVPFGSQATESMITCAEKCGISAETVTLAKEWKTENDAWTKRQQETGTSRTTQNALAPELAFLIVALPLFALHFRTWWKEKQQGQLSRNS